MVKNIQQKMIHALVLAPFLVNLPFFGATRSETFCPVSPAISNFGASARACFRISVEFVGPLIALSSLGPPRMSSSFCQRSSKKRAIMSGACRLAWSRPSIKRFSDAWASFRRSGTRALIRLSLPRTAATSLLNCSKRLPVQRVQAAVAEHFKVAHHVAFGKTVEHLGDAGNRQGLEHTL